MSATLNVVEILAPTIRNYSHVLSIREKEKSQWGVSWEIKKVPGVRDR